MSRMVIGCPQCGHPARIRHSEAMSPHIRLQIFQCRRLGCGCQWKVLAETVAIIAASALPGAQLSLPHLNAADCTALFLNDHQRKPPPRQRPRRALTGQARHVTARSHNQTRQQRQKGYLPWAAIYPTQKHMQRKSSVKHNQQPSQHAYSQPSLLPPFCLEQQQTQANKPIK